MMLVVKVCPFMREHHLTVLRGQRVKKTTRHNDAAGIAGRGVGDRLAGLEDREMPACSPLDRPAPTTQDTANAPRHHHRSDDRDKTLEKADLMVKRYDRTPFDQRQHQC